MSRSSSPFLWERLGDPAPAALGDARAQLHWAAQLAGAAGKAWAEPADDWSHVSLSWSREHGALVGAPLAGAEVRAGLRLRDAALLILDGGGSGSVEVPLAGISLEEGADRLVDALSGAAGKALPGELEWRKGGLPEHAVAEGGRLMPDEAAFAEVARWYGNAAGALERLANEMAHSSPVRCWPHHFDIAALSLLDPGADPETARSINAGMSPGDGSYADPYWYVTPWPAPAAGRLPDLAVGAWHTEGFTAAVLTAADLLAAGDGDAQAARATEFLTSAAAAAHSLLESPA